MSAAKIQTLDLRIMGQMFYHCAMNVGIAYGKFDRSFSLNIERKRPSLLWVGDSSDNKSLAANVVMTSYQCSCLRVIVILRNVVRPEGG